MTDLISTEEVKSRGVEDQCIVLHLTIGPFSQVNVLMNLKGLTSKQKLEKKHKTLLCSYNFYYCYLEQ